MEADGESNSNYKIVRFIDNSFIFFSLFFSTIAFFVNKRGTCVGKEQIKKYYIKKGRKGGENAC